MRALRGLLLLLCISPPVSTWAWEKTTILNWTERTNFRRSAERIPLFEAVRGGPGNLLHLVWDEYHGSLKDGHSVELWYTVQVTSCAGLFWAEPQLLYSEFRQGIFYFRPSIAVSEEGCVGILYWAAGTSSNFSLHYMQLCPGNEPVIEEVPDSAQNESIRPSDLVFGSDGTAHVAFNKVMPNHLLYARRSLAGVWTTEDVGYVWNPMYPLAIALDPGGNPVLAFHNAGPITTDVATRLPDCEVDCWVMETIASGGDGSVDLVIGTLDGERTVGHSTALWWSDLVAELHSNIDGGVYVVEESDGQDVGRSVSLALLGGKHPAASYYNKTTRQLHFAHAEIAPWAIGWDAEVVLGSEADEEAESGQDIGLFSYLTRIAGTTWEPVAEIVYWKAPPGIVLGGGSEWDNEIKLAAQPSVEDASIVCPQPQAPDCSPLPSCPQSSGDVVITQRSSAEALRPCLDCPPVFIPDICGYIYCPSGDSSPLCDECLGTVELQPEFKGESWGTFWVDDFALLDPKMESGWIRAWWDGVWFHDVSNLPPAIPPPSFVKAEVVHSAGAWNVKVIQQ